MAECLVQQKNVVNFKGGQFWGVSFLRIKERSQKWIFSHTIKTWEQPPFHLTLRPSFASWTQMISVQRCVEECSWLNTSGAEERKWQWERLDCSATTMRSQPTPQGGLEQAWLFRVVLSLDKGAGLFNLSTGQSLGMGCPKTGAGRGRGRELAGGGGGDDLEQECSLHLMVLSRERRQPTTFPAVKGISPLVLKGESEWCLTGPQTHGNSLQ